MFILNLINWEDLEFLDYLTGVREKLVEINVIWDGSKIEERLIRCLLRLVLFVQFGTKRKKNTWIYLLHAWNTILNRHNAHEKKNTKFDVEFWKFYFWHIKSDSVWKKVKKSNLTKKKSFVHEVNVCFEMWSVDSCMFSLIHVN